VVHWNILLHKIPHFVLLCFRRYTILHIGYGRRHTLCSDQWSVGHVRPERMGGYLFSLPLILISHISHHNTLIVISSVTFISASFKLRSAAMPNSPTRGGWMGIWSRSHVLHPQNWKLGQNRAVQDNCRARLPIRPYIRHILEPCSCSSNGQGTWVCNGSCNSGSGELGPAL
jgi:hypothetical protein